MMRQRSSSLRTTFGKGLPSWLEATTPAAVITGVLTAVLVSASGCTTAPRPNTAAANITADERAMIDDLIAQMTVREKAGQMTQLTFDGLTDPEEEARIEYMLDEPAARQALIDYAVGSILNTPGVAISRDRWRPLVDTVQSLAGESRLGIPVIYGIDSVHGANYIIGGTVFPHNLNLGATFDPEHARVGSYWSAAETRSAGLPWTFAPVGDVMRIPTWSRVFETFGESPVLCAEMATASVKGFQQDNLSSHTSVAACGKHFLAYSHPRSGRDRTPAIVSDAELYDTFLPPFKQMVEAGVRTVMVNSGEVNGVPAHANPEYLTRMLREDLGFTGVVVTDWEDVIKLHEFHKVAATEREATRLAVEAGIDIAMTPYELTFTDYLTDLVETGEISERRLDESVRRILTLKVELGLFDEVMPPESEMIPLRLPEAVAASLDAARESIVLMRNRGGVLPLSTDARILVTGPGADDVVPMHGSWTYSWQGTEPRLYPESPTLLDELRERFGNANLTYIPGATIDEPINIRAAADAAAGADAVILVLAEQPSAEGPGDIYDLDLARAQLDLARAVADTGTPVITVLVTNRPRLITHVEESLDAIMWAGHPGPEGPRAIAEIITGEVNPSAKLPFTYPNDPHGLLTYDHKNTEVRGPFSDDDGGYTPLYPFGHGLSYTTFDYTNLRAVPIEFAGDNMTDALVRVTVTVQNSGDRRGREPVLLFARDEYASVTPHVRRLRAFDHVELFPGQSETVEFVLTRQDLAFGGPEGGMLFEPGAFSFMVGDQERAVLLGE